MLQNLYVCEMTVLYYEFLDFNKWLANIKGIVYYFQSYVVLKKGSFLTEKVKDTR